VKNCVNLFDIFARYTKGIPRGYPLSPLLGAFFLTELDNTLEQQDVFYVRYRDNVLIMSKRRWGLRKAIKRLNEIFSALGLEQHPDKTFIGRIEKGFDFLGYHFSRKGLRLARKTLTNALEKWHRLYEQRKTAPESAVDPGAYWRRWCSWATGGLDASIFRIEESLRLTCKPLYPHQSCQRRHK
jgi:RNA-directed DNA polymerase